MRRLVVLAALLVGCSAAPVPFEPEPTRPPVHLSGSGTKQTQPFLLGPGNVNVAWTASTTNNVGCFHDARLRSPDDPAVSEGAGTGDPGPHGKTSGTTSIYRLKGGRYYLDATSGCDWTVDITAQ